jgi:hypothetical protein
MDMLHNRQAGKPRRLVTGAFGLCLLLQLQPFAGTAAAAGATQAPVDEDELLRSSIEKAKEQISLGNQAEALRILEKAYASVPTPALLWPIAELHLRLEHPKEGLATLDKYVALVPPAKMPKDQQMADVERMQGELRKQLARIKVASIDPGAKALVDGQPVEPAELDQPLEVNPGRHFLEVRLGTRSLTREVRVQSGQELRVELQLPALSEEKDSAAALPVRFGRSQRIRRTAYFVVGGVGLLGVLTGGILWGLDGLQSCPQAPMCPQALDTKAAGIGLFASGLGLSVGALALGLVDWRTSRKSAGLLEGRF